MSRVVSVVLPAYNEEATIEEGEILQLGRFEVEVIDMDDRRIDKLLFKPVTNLSQTSDSGEA